MASWDENINHSQLWSPQNLFYGFDTSMNNATYYNVQNIRKNIFTAWLFFYSTLSKAWFLQHLWKKDHNTNLLLYYTLLSTYYAPGIPCIFCSRLTMALWRQCCYYLHFINEEMEDCERGEGQTVQEIKAGYESQSALVQSPCSSDSMKFKGNSKYYCDIGFHRTLTCLGLWGNHLGN